MTQQQAEQIIADIWERHGMTDNSGTDAVRAELVAALLSAYENGKSDK